VLQLYASVARAHECHQQLERRQVNPSSLSPGGCASRFARARLRTLIRRHAQTIRRISIIAAILIMLAAPSCKFLFDEAPSVDHGPPMITPQSLLAWDRPTSGQQIGWKLCVDAHPCVSLGPIAPTTTHGSTDTFRGHFWSDQVAPYLTPGTHTLAVTVYGVRDQMVSSARSAPITVRVDPRSPADPRPHVLVLP
jgi:hypothetical protein